MPIMPNGVFRLREEIEGEIASARSFAEIYRRFSKQGGEERRRRALHLAEEQETKVRELQNILGAA